MDKYFESVLHWVEAHPGLTALAAVISAASAFLAMCVAAAAMDINATLTYRMFLLIKYKTRLEMKELEARLEEREKRIYRPKISD